MFAKKNKKNADIFSQLSEELIIKILSNLELNQLLQVGLLSKKLHRITNDNHLFFNLFANVKSNGNFHYNKSIDYKEIHKRLRLEQLQSQQLISPAETEWLKQKEKAKTEWLAKIDQRLTYIAEMDDYEHQKREILNQKFRR